MNLSADISRASAAKILGSVWHADPDTKTIMENLGHNSPPFHSGESFTTADEAIAQNPAGYKIVSMPSTVRLPKGTPVVMPSTTPLTTASTQIFLLCFGDIMERGLRIKRHRIERVDYMPSPARLRHAYDFVAGHAYFGGDDPMRVRIGHDSEGYPYADQVPYRHGIVGWTPNEDSLAFLTREEAEAYADDMADRLRTAANWREK